MNVLPQRQNPSILNIGLLCPHDTTDRNTFSGTPFLPRAPWANVRNYAFTPMGYARARGRLRQLLARASAPKAPLPNMDHLDAVLGLVSTRLVPSLPTGLPYFHVTDATPAFLREFYDRPTAADADAAERAAVARAECVIYSSAAMAARAPADLELPDFERAVLPFGINFDQLPSVVPPKPSTNAPNLLFVGRDWHRKGGDIAVSILDRLRNTQSAATLTIVGPVPADLTPRPGLHIVGALDKNKQDEARLLSRLYAESHLLILPTRGDCTPMVMARWPMEHRFW